MQRGREITLGGWSARFVREVLGLSEDRSILTLSLFWAGMVGARLVLSQLLRSRSPAAVFPVFLTVALAGAGVMLARQTPASAGLGLLLLGAGLSAGFPILLGLLGGVYQDLTGTAFSAVFVMALVGGSTISYATGLTGDRFGLRAALLVVPLCVVAQGLLFLPLLRRLGAGEPGRNEVAGLGE
jgi:fucose permease